VDLGDGVIVAVFEAGVVEGVRVGDADIAAVAVGVYVGNVGQSRSRVGSQVAVGLGSSPIVPSAFTTGMGEVLPLTTTAWSETHPPEPSSSPMNHHGPAAERPRIGRTSR
jgi:hypothetical protein